MSAYFDTSVWISLYMRDSNYQAALSVRAANPDAFWTPWQRLEFNNAVRTCVTRGKIVLADVRGIENAIQAAVKNGELAPRPLPAYALWQEAEKLSRAHTPAIGVRTLDLLHVAAARVLKAARFCTFDTRQHALARAAGLQIN
jgi:predicted nucleic acid-binding protein